MNYVRYYISSAPMPPLPDIDPNAVVENAAIIKYDDQSYQLGLLERQEIVRTFFNF